jgi:methyl-accepting chemotaxis protein
MSATTPEEASAVSGIEQQQKERDALRVLAAVDRTQAVAEFDLEGKVLRVNERFLEAMGYRAEEVIGRHHSMFCQPQVAQGEEYQQFWAQLREGSVQQGEFLRLNQAGWPVWLQATYTPIPDEKGDTVKVIKFASDITASKQISLENRGKMEAIQRSQAVIEFDLDGRVLEANEIFLGLMGYRREEVVGKHHSMFVPKAEAESPAYRRFWQKLGSGAYEGDEYLRLGKNGKRVWIQATYNPILDLDGNPFKIVKFATDITAGKLAALENSARMAAIDGTTCLMALDRDRRILHANDLMLQSLGYDSKDLEGRMEDDLVFEEERNDEQWQQIWSGLREGRAGLLECRRRGAGKAERWFDFAFNPIMGFDGVLVKVIVAGRDITEEKLSRLEAAGKLAAIDRAQAVIEFDLKGKVLAVNENFLELTGYQRDDIVGRHHRMFVDPEYAASSAYQDFWDRLGRGEFESGEYKRIGRNGAEVWIRATYNPVFGPHGNPVRVVKFATDVTAAKLRNAEFEAKVAAIDLGQAVIEFDLDGKVLTANRNFLKAMGYTLREIVGQHHSQFCTLDYAQSEDYRDFWLKLGEGQFISGRFHRVGKFNRDVWIQATYNPIRDLNGRVVKVIKYAYDVTKEVRLEKAIASRSQEMKQGMQSLAASIAEIAENSGVASEVAGDTSRAAESGFGALQKSIQAIDAIQAGSRRVAEIVSVISDIAGQTNLLAFNAAIEAARAGAQGVGFSVVAAEVRRLAERSSQAAAEIAALIEESGRQVQNGAEVTREAAAKFEGISASVKRTGTSVTAIAKAADSQHKMSGSFSTLIDDLTGQVGK